MNELLNLGEVESLATCRDFKSGRFGEYCENCGNSVVRHVVRALTDACRAQVLEINVLKGELQEERAAHSRSGVGA